MAGKHYGNADYFGEARGGTNIFPANKAAYPGSKENRAWGEGATGFAPRPPDSDPVGQAAYDAGGASLEKHESSTAGGGIRGPAVSPAAGWFYVSAAGTRTTNLPPSSQVGLNEEAIWADPSLQWDSVMNAAEAAAQWRVDNAIPPGTYSGIVVQSGAQDLGNGFTNTLAGQLWVVIEGRDSTAEYRQDGTNQTHYNWASDVPLDVYVRNLIHSHTGTSVNNSANGAVLQSSRSLHEVFIFDNCQFQNQNIDRSAAPWNNGGGMFALQNNGPDFALRNCEINGLTYDGHSTTVNRQHACLGYTNYDGEIFLENVTVNAPTLSTNTNTNALVLFQSGEDNSANFASNFQAINVVLSGGSTTSSVQGANLCGLFNQYATAAGMGISQANERVYTRCRTLNFTRDGQGTAGASPYGCVLYLEQGYGRARLVSCSVENIITEISRNAVGGLCTVLGDHGAATNQRAFAILENCTANNVQDTFGALCYPTAGGSAQIIGGSVTNCFATKTHNEGIASGTALYKGGTGNMTVQGTTIDNCNSARPDFQGKSIVFLLNTNTGTNRDSQCTMSSVTVLNSFAEDPPGNGIISVSSAQDVGNTITLTLNGCRIDGTGSTRPNTNQIVAQGAGPGAVATVNGGGSAGNSIRGGDAGVTLNANSANDLVNTQDTGTP